MLLACVAGSLVIAAGCNRQDTPATTPARERKPPARKRVEPGPLSAEANAPSQRGDRMQPGMEGATQPEATGPPREANTQEADALFDSRNLLQIQIQIPPSGLDALRGTRWGNGQIRPVVKATIREGGIVYPNVAVHLKGALGSFRPVDDKPGLTLVFNKFVKGQSFHGLHKISLNNSVQDPSYLSEKIARELFLAANVPVPRAGHALVTLNGRDLGLYVLLEGANRQFLKRYFSNVNGNLYDGGFCQDISTSLTVTCGESPNNHAGMKALLAAVREPRPSFARLEQVLDMDRFLSMLAMESLLWHWDGYSFNRNNWRIFHDMDANKMVFIPHGLDQLFGVGRQIEAGNPLAPRRVDGVVSRMVLATPEGHQRYLERARQLYANVIKVDAILSRVDQIVAEIGPALAQTHPDIAKSMRQRAGSLKNRIIRRDEGMWRQFGVPVHPAQFASDNVLRLTGWKPSSVQSGDPMLTQIEEPPGKTLLSINAGNEISSGSWRTRVVLAAGRYQLEGRLRLSGVVIEAGDDRGGAGLRISKGTMPRKLTGTSDWRDFQYSFTVTEETADVELVCELRALKGEAWFDPSSLRLVRLP